MKKCFGRSITILLVLILAQCANKEKKQIIGVWQLEQMDINGTRIDGHDIGRWLWEFNDEGGYLTNVAGAVEKGSYKLKNDELKIQITTEKNRVEQIYMIQKLDSLHLELVSTGDSNKGLLHFVKWQGSVEEEDD